MSESTTQSPIIRPLQQKHYSAVADIYQQAIDKGNITVARLPDTWEKWDTAHLPLQRFVALDGEQVVGWCALSPVLQRTGYDGVTELSIYVHDAFQDKGIGSLLLTYLLDHAEKTGIWTILAFIFPQNQGSIKFHERFGFRLLGTQEKAVKLNGVWMDNCIFEHRSKLIL